MEARNADSAPGLSSKGNENEQKHIARRGIFPRRCSFESEFLRSEIERAHSPKKFEELHGETTRDGSRNPQPRSESGAPSEFVVPMFHVPTFGY